MKGALKDTMEGLVKGAQKDLLKTWMEDLMEGLDGSLNGVRRVVQPCGIGRVS